MYFSTDVEFTNNDSHGKMSANKVQLHKKTPPMYEKSNTGMF